MKIEYSVTIGIPGAEIQSEVEVDDNEFEGLTQDERDEKITKLVWEDGLQYVDMPWKIVK